MKRSILVVGTFILVGIIGVGCNSGKQGTPAPGSPTPGYQGQPAAPTAAAPATQAQPAGAMPPAAAGDALSGKIVETMNAGGYTYVCLENSGKKTWVAMPMTQVKVGQQVTCQPGAEMRNFTSPTLKRTFDSIIFSAGLR
jgi:hypothetical protein